MKQLHRALFLAQLFIFCFGSFAAQAQKSEMTFEKVNHNYGTIQEKSGQATHVFNFKNTGDGPLVITNVHASCGCTTPEWTKTPVAPGKKGFVKVTYNPRNRPGAFRKTISVSSNAKQGMVTLTIQGEVEPRPLTLEEQFPYNMDGLRLKRSHLSFARISNKESKTKTIEVVNTTKKILAVTFENVPSHMKMVMKPTSLKAGEKGVVEVAYDASRKEDWGFVIDRVNMLLNGNKNYKNRLAVSATIQEDFSKLSADEVANAPKVKIGETIFNFGEVKQGAKVEHVFMIKNEGKHDLIIRKIKTSCGCTAAKPSREVIPAGQSSELKVSFNSSGRSGRQHKSVTIITNDPKKQTLLLRITGEVKS